MLTGPSGAFGRTSTAKIYGFRRKRKYSIHLLNVTKVFFLPLRNCVGFRSSRTWTWSESPFFVEKGGGLLARALRLDTIDVDCRQAISVDPPRTRSSRWIWGTRTDIEVQAVLVLKSCNVHIKSSILFQCFATVLNAAATICSEAGEEHWVKLKDNACVFEGIFDMKMETVSKMDLFFCIIFCDIVSKRTQILHCRVPYV